MSTHNIGFYEDLTKIIFELSSYIIKYTPCFFCCTMYFLALNKLLLLNWNFTALPHISGNIKHSKLSLPHRSWTIYRSIEHILSYRSYVKTACADIRVITANC